MTDTFGIFVEDLVPAVHGVFKDVPTFIKGKGNSQHIKKKALGDVSNTVSQKVLNVQPHERGGKLFAEPCSASQQELSTSCKPVSGVKETSEENPDGFSECDYDIVSKSQRLTEEEMDLYSSFYCYQPISPISSPASGFDRPDLSPPMITAPLPFDEFEDLHFSDVSIPSLDDPDFSEVSF